VENLLLLVARERSDAWQSVIGIIAGSTHDGDTHDRASSEAVSPEMGRRWGISLQGDLKAPVACNFHISARNLKIVNS